MIARPSPLVRTLVLLTVASLSFVIALWRGVGALGAASDAPDLRPATRRLLSALGAAVFTGIVLGAWMFGEP